MHSNQVVSGTLPNKANVLRGLGLVAAASIVVGNMVGQGVFLKARVMTCNVGTPSMVIAVWIATGLLTLAGALTLAELAAMMPKSGGIYVFLREAYGARWGFLYGWMDFVVGNVSIATGGVAFAIFLNVVTGGAFSGEIFAFDLSGVKVSLRTAQAVAVTIIGVVMLVNCVAVSLGGRVATVLTIMKIARQTEKNPQHEILIIGQSVVLRFLLFGERCRTLKDLNRTFGYPFVPALFLVVTAWLLVNTLLTSPIRSILGLVLIALGLPFYSYRRKRNYVEPLNY
ncbi:MAG: amino acid permease [Pyrinomonadaceae bacterium]